jgi:hypothetical protein
LPLAGDPDPMVRFQTALTLGEANSDPRAIAALSAIADAWSEAMPAEPPHLVSAPTRAA